jgi:hypothetical protein
MAFSRRKWLAIPTALAMVLLGGPLAPLANPQSTGTVYVPDPTPRDRDLHDRYSDTPALQQQKSRMAAMRRAQLRVQAAADTNEILLLAQQLRSHRIQHEAPVSGPSDASTAQKIESLAKRVRENLQSQ